MDLGQIIAQRYRLGRKLGEGGMGTVYQAEHVITGRQLAVKILERRDKLAPEAVDRFLREARAPAAIGHPNVVEVIDAGTEPDGTPFIAMELLEGETLDEVIKREHVVQPPMLGVVMQQLLDGLDAMHARGFVHRDLKPANIFLQGPIGAPTRIKLLDFGIAKALGEEGRTRSGYVIGTPAYMAPEQMRNARSATPRSDLWSVGVMLYEALAGHRPFRGETFGLLAQISGPLGHVLLSQAASYLPRELTDLVDSLLAKDLNERPGSAAEVRDRLLPLLAACPPVHPVDLPDDERDAPREIERADTERSTNGSPIVDPSWRDDPSPLQQQSSASLSDAIPLARPRNNDLVQRILLALAVIIAAIIAAVFVVRGTDSHSGSSGNHHSATPATSALVGSNAELSDFLHRWLGTVTGAQGTSPVDAFYADTVKFRTTTGSVSPTAVQRQWADLFSDGGSFGIDWDRSRVSDESPELSNGVSAVCINLPGASGRIIKVRAWATEIVQSRSAGIGCRRLEGVYLIRLRRVAGALRICHETWSLREGICASCPTAPVCQDGGSQHP